MQYQMRLHPEPFNKIKAGTKRIEMRLNDEKRQALKVGDMLEFENRADGSRIMTEITSLDHFKSFNELYAHFDKKDLGYADNEKANPEDMSIYYSTEDIQKYGTLAIGVKKI